MKKLNKVLAMLLLLLLVLQGALPLSMADSVAEVEDSIETLMETETEKVEEIPKEEETAKSEEETQNEDPALTDDQVEPLKAEEITPLEESRSGVLSVAEAMALPLDKRVVTVRGYIVGYALSGKTYDTDLEHDNAVTNLAIADNMGNTVFMPVQLPKGKIREEWQLKINPDNLGKRVLITAKLEKYFGVPGLKSPVSIVLDEEQEPEEGFKLTYDLDGGSQSDSSIPLVYTLNNEQVHSLLSAEDLTATKESEIFEGWKKEGSDELLKPGTEVSLTEDTTFVAQWKPKTEPGENEVKITFDTSAYTGEKIDPVILKKGNNFYFDKKTMPFPSDMEKQYFDHWYKLEGEKEIYVNQSSNFEESTTLYPKYFDKKPVKFHTIFNLSLKSFPLNYAIYKDDGTLVKENLIGSDEKNAHILPEGNYYLIIKADQFIQNGIKYDEPVSYTRDNYDEPLDSRQTGRGDLSQGSFDAEGNFKLNFLIRAAARSTTYNSSSHRAFAWLNFDASNTRSIVVIPNSNDYQMEAHLRKTLKVAYSDGKTTIENIPGSMNTIIPTGNFHASFSNFPKGMKGEAYIGNKKLAEGDLYGDEKKQINLYVRPEQAPDFPDDLTGYMIANVTFNIRPDADGANVGLVVKSGDATLVPTQRNAAQYQQMIDQREYEVTLKDLASNKEIDRVVIGTTEAKIIKLAHNKFKFTPKFPYSFAGVYIHLKDREEITHKVIYDANGGTFKDDAVTELEVKDQTEIKLPYHFSLGLKKEGQVFKGWLLEGSEPAKIYKGANTFTVTKDTKFIAQWEDVKGQLILFVADKFLGDKIPEPYLVGEDETEYALNSNSYSDRDRTWETEKEVLLNGKYTLKFRGLEEDQTVILENAAPSLKSTVEISSNEAGEDVLSFAFDEGTFPSSRFVKVKATVVDPEKYTVSFEAGENGKLEGTLEFTDILKGTKWEDALTVPTPVAEDGYRFASWEPELPTDDFAIEKDLSFKANFEKVSVVTFNLNYDGAPEAQVVEADEEDKVEAPKEPTREGYDFAGWFKDANGEGEAIDFTTEIFTEDMTLYAKWVKQAPKKVVLKDDATGIIVEGDEESLPEEYELFTQAVKHKLLDFSSEIHLRNKVTKEQVQPKGKITVYYPLPENYQIKKGFKFGFINAQDKLEEYPYEMRARTIAFSTKHLSVWGGVAAKETDPVKPADPEKPKDDDKKADDSKKEEKKKLPGTGAVPLSNMLLLGFVFLGAGSYLRRKED